MRRLLSLLAVGSLVALALSWGGCEAPSSDSDLVAASSHELSVFHPRIRAIMAVQERHTPDLMSRTGVVGTATGLSADGQLVVKIYTLHPGVQNLPTKLDGIRTEVEVTGKIRALGGLAVPVGQAEPDRAGGGGGNSHTAKQTPPIQLGTSGGWRYDLANGYCCGGTLGALVQKGGVQYVLSNYHVLEADIVSGGNSRVAQAGDPVIQPGLVDVSCNAAGTQNVATLSGIKSLPNSNVDAAIAQVTTGMVRTDGAILEIGTISAQTVAASLNQLVKKSGRTTGLTRSAVSGLNATVLVAYDNECAGGAAFTKTFTGQIVVANALRKGKKFIDSGDSGSLMVQDVTTNPKAVGLLFAGSNTTAIANPINEVLTFLGATMVGQ